MKRDLHVLQTLMITMSIDIIIESIHVKDLAVKSMLFVAACMCVSVSLCVCS